MELLYLVQNQVKTYASVGQTHVVVCITANCGAPCDYVIQLSISLGG
jgi:hypothetical protein